VRETLHNMAPPDCDGDYCAADKDEWRAELMH
jgi:hypothetical protein